MVHIQANMFVCAKSSIKKNTYHWRKLYRWLSLLIIIKPFSKRNSLQGWLYHWFFNSPEKKLPAEKRYTNEWDCFSIYKHVIKKGPKVYCFAGFCHHHLTTMSVHMDAYCYPLFESGTEISLRTIVLC